MSYALWWIMHYEVMRYDLFNCIRIVGETLEDLIVVPALELLESLDAIVLWPSTTSLHRCALVSSNRHTLTR